MFQHSLLQSSLTGYEVEYEYFRPYKLGNSKLLKHKVLKIFRTLIGYVAQFCETGIAKVRQIIVEIYDSGSWTEKGTELCYLYPTHIHDILFWWRQFGVKSSLHIRYV